MATPAIALIDAEYHSIAAQFVSRLPNLVEGYDEAKYSKDAYDRADSCVLTPVENVRRRRSPQRGDLDKALMVFGQPR